MGYKYQGLYLVSGPQEGETYSQKGPFCEQILFNDWKVFLFMGQNLEYPLHLIWSLYFIHIFMVLPSFYFQIDGPHLHGKELPVLEAATDYFVFLHP